MGSARRDRVSAIPTVVWLLCVGASALGTSEEMALACSPLLLMLFPVIVLIQHFHLAQRHVPWWAGLTVNTAVLTCYVWFVATIFPDFSSPS